MFIVDKDIPLPAKVRRTNSKYPFDTMEPGDSFFVAAKKATSIQRTAAHAGKRLGMKFRSVEVSEGGVDGTRCWRVE